MEIKWKKHPNIPKPAWHQNEIQPFDGSDIVSIFTRVTTENTPVVSTHLIPPKYLTKLAEMIPIAKTLVEKFVNNHPVELKPKTLRINTGEFSDMTFALAHINEAIARPDHGIDIVSEESVHSIPPVCKTQLIVLAINAMLAGQIDIQDPHRPTCRTCINFQERACQLKPNPIQSHCCQAAPNSEWCPNHQRTKRERPTIIS